MFRVLVIAAALMLMVPLGAYGTAFVDTPLSLVATCQGCVERDGVLAAAADTAITFAVVGEQAPLTAYWIFGDGAVQDGGLTATHSYRSGTYTVQVYAFFKDAEPVVVTKDVLVTESAQILPKISDGNQIQQIVVLVTAVISLITLLYQIFIPA